MNSIINSPAPTFLSQLKDIATVIIAIANLALGTYVFIYQRRKDNKQNQKDAENNLKAAQLNEQNIKLQWFKELIVQPKLADINSFYSNLHSVKNAINSNDLTEDEKATINTFVKSEQRKFRKAFIDVLHDIEPDFAIEAQNQIDELVDNITEAIFNDELKLKNEATYEKAIGSKIDFSKNKLIAQIYSYKGI